MFTLHAYRPEEKNEWHTFVANSLNGTLFHRLDFLEYHGERFKAKEHHLVWRKGEAMYAVMPLLIDEVDGKKIIKSPYGASLGGLVVSKKFKLRHAVALVESLNEWIVENNIHQCYLTLPPQNYYTPYSNYLEFALCSNGFRIRQREVFSVVELQDSVEKQWAAMEGRSRTTIKKFRGEWEITSDATMADFFPILAEDKWRHGESTPTHTLEELEWLKAQFPTEIYCDIATHKAKGARAAICYFQVNARNMMTFYMAQETAALRLNGTNILVWKGMQDAIANGMEYFDFGGSTLGYHIQNIGVAEFKESFGARGMSRDSFELCRD